jgi:mono/diheme cytochrome c family protein
LLCAESSTTISIGPKVLVARRFGAPIAGGPSVPKSNSRLPEKTRLFAGGWRAGAALLALFAGLTAPALAADAKHGEKLARRWCAACHIVADDQKQGADNVPTFAAIAKMPGLNASRLSRFLRDPHPKMPDMQLSTKEAGDLAAYIVSQGK